MSAWKSFIKGASGWAKRTGPSLMRGDALSPMGDAAARIGIGLTTGTAKVAFGSKGKAGAVGWLGSKIIGKKSLRQSASEIGRNVRAGYKTAMFQDAKWETKQARKYITKQQTRLKKGQSIANKLANRFGSKVGNAALGSTIALGAVASASLGLMNGMNNQARDYMHDRYIQDYTYSRSVLTNSRIGRSSGTRAIDRYGSTLGLSNSLSATRHGR